MKKVRILIADDHEMVRRGVRSIIESKPGWSVCAEAVNGREAIAMATSHVPDIIVMDVTMPELNGLEATRQIHKNHPEMAIIILSMHESEQLVREIVAAGAKGYLLKTDAGTLLVQAIRSVIARRPFFTSNVADALAHDVGRSSPSGVDGEALTPREREIVQLIAEGRSSKEVAARLDISVKTADTHRANVMRKLNLHSVSELVRYAIRNNIVEA